MIFSLNSPHRKTTTGFIIIVVQSKECLFCACSKNIFISFILSKKNRNLTVGKIKYYGYWFPVQDEKKGIAEKIGKEMGKKEFVAVGRRPGKKAN